MGFLRETLNFIIKPSRYRTVVFLIIIVSIAIPLTVIFSQQRQEIRQRAAEPQAIPASECSPPYSGYLGCLTENGCGNVGISSQVSCSDENVQQGVYCYESTKQGQTCSVNEGSGTCDDKGNCVVFTEAIQETTPFQPQAPTLTPTEEIVLPTIPTTTAPILSSCGEITQPGNYILDKDLEAGNVCLDVHDVNNVNINCNGHLISATPSTIPGTGTFTYFIHSPVRFKNVKGFSLTSCILKFSDNVGEIGGRSLLITNSNDGSISNNKFEHSLSVNIETSSNLKIFNNNFTGIYFELKHSSNNIIDNNDLTASTSVSPALIGLLYGMNNQITNNKIDGSSDGIFYHDSSKRIGADDGIIIDGELGDTIQNNYIKNVWDCGVETSFTITDTKIIGNSISNAGYCGIGSWYFTSWKGNTVSNNNLENSQAMFIITMDSARAKGTNDYPQQDFVYFKDNTFIGNKFINPRKTDSSVSVLGSYIIDMTYKDYLSNPSELPLKPENIIIGNNLFKDNDFNSQINAPVLKPASIFVDGGGNKCGTTTQADFPLKCTQNNNTQSTGSTPAATLQGCYLKNKGDADCDDKITRDDYKIWENEFVSEINGIFTQKQSDFNTDGAITIVDFNIWKTYVGKN